MPSSDDLGKKHEAKVQKLVAKGRYNSRKDVLREGVRLVEIREKALAKLDAAVARGIADVEAGRVHTSEEVFGELRRRIRRIAAQRAKKRA